MWLRPRNLGLLLKLASSSHNLESLHVTAAELAKNCEVCLTLLKSLDLLLRSLFGSFRRIALDQRQQPTGRGSTFQSKAILERDQGCPLNIDIYLLGRADARNKPCRQRANDVGPPYRTIPAYVSDGVHRVKRSSPLTRQVREIIHISFHRRAGRSLFSSERTLSCARGILRGMATRGLFRTKRDLANSSRQSANC